MIPSAGFVRVTLKMTVCHAKKKIEQTFRMQKVYFCQNVQLRTGNVCARIRRGLGVSGEILRGCMDV